MVSNVVRRGEMPCPIYGSKYGRIIRWARYVNNECDGAMSYVFKSAFKGRVASAVWDEMNNFASDKSQRTKKKEFDAAVATYIAKERGDPLPEQEAPTSVKCYFTCASCHARIHKLS